MLRYKSMVTKLPGQQGTYVRMLALQGHRVGRMAVGSKGWVSSLKLSGFNKY